MAANLMNLTTIAGRDASRSSALVGDALNGLVRTNVMATKLNDRTDRAAAQASAAGQPSSSSLRPTLNERHESICIPTFGLTTVGYPRSYQWKGSTGSIRGGRPRIAGAT